MTLNFTEEEKKWLREVAAMPIKPNPPYGNHHITAAKKIVAVLDEAA